MIVDGRSIFFWIGWIVLAAAAPPAKAADHVGAKRSSEQIASALLAAPEDRRDGARVLGYTSAGTLVQLRPGTNDLVCLADDPKLEGFSAACYHRDLEPYMARGRALAAAGKDREASLKMRWAEIDAGKLEIPRSPRTLYVLRGKAYDPKAGTVDEAYLRWVIYTPYATSESTGLPTSAPPGAPWIMFPGTAGAHIMIMPAQS